MAALQHHFLHGLRAHAELQYPVRSPTTERVRYNDLHMGQSNLDASCGLHSVAMAAMCLTGIARHRVQKIASTERGPLKDLWELARHKYFEGTELTDLQDYVAVFAPELSCDSFSGKGTKRIASAVAQAIAEGQAPIVGIEAKTFSHWVLVTGVEVQSGDPTPRALLILDPSAPRPWGAFFNARLELQAQARTTRTRKPYVLGYRFMDGQVRGAHLDGLVVVKRAAQGP